MSYRKMNAAKLPRLESIEVDDHNPQALVAYLLSHGWKGMVVQAGKDDENQSDMLVFSGRHMLQFARDALGLDWMTEAVMAACVRDLKGERLRGHAMIYYAFHLETYERIMCDVLRNPPVRSKGTKEFCDEFLKRIEREKAA